MHIREIPTLTAQQKMNKDERAQYPSYRKVSGK